MTSQTVPGAASFRRERSAIEQLGFYAALTVAFVTIETLVYWLWGAQMRSATENLTFFINGWRREFVRAGVVMLIVVAGLPRLPSRPLLRWPALALLVALAAAASWHALHLYLMLRNGRGIPPPMKLTDAHSSVWVTLLFVGVGEASRRGTRAVEALHRTEIARLHSQSKLADARTQVLRAQIEPHFLFNSLANARRLLRTDGAAGRAMLTDLLRYLETALPRMRAEESTVARETELVRAFLAVHQVRMGPRLQVALNVPAALGDLRVPPMMLITLVENALKHGIYPLPEGGAIVVGASLADGRLTLSVADTGRGLVAGSGHGTGLANVRARLAALYGTPSALTLRLNEPHGVVAAIVLPAR